MYGFVLCGKGYNYYVKIEKIFKKSTKMYWHIGHDMILYNQKGGKQMSKQKKKKPKKIKKLLAQAVIDLTVGLILLIIDKLL